MHLLINIVENDIANSTPALQQAALNTRIGEIVDAYYEDNHDAIFYHDDGTPTRHSLISNDSISGVKVLHRSWPTDAPGEYATCRTGQVVLQAEYIEPESAIVYYEEGLAHVSTGGPRWHVQDVFNGPPIYQLVCNQTHQVIVQYGTAIGLQGWPQLGVHFFPVYPQWEHVDRRRVTPMHPKSHTNGFTHFPITWQFIFSLPYGTSTYPYLHNE